MLVLATALSSGYFLLILFFLKHWRASPEWRSHHDFEPLAKVTVLVPARNEEDHIENCLRSIQEQSYPQHLVEIVLIDDHSTDDTVARALALDIPNLKILRMADHPADEAGLAYKKQALAAGIRHSKGEIILCTDADCIVPPKWVALFSAYFEEVDPVFVAGPVGIYQPSNPLEYFQALDFLGTNLISCAGHNTGVLHLANGANLAFSRSAYEEVGGYRGISHIASGDDLLLLQKMMEQFPGHSGYVKHPEALVRTGAMPDWHTFIGQRLRWASKSSAYREHTATIIWGLVFLVSGAIMATSFLAALGIPGMMHAMFILLFGKIAADTLLLGEAAHYFRSKDLLRDFWYAELMHIIYVPWVVVLALKTKDYTWKGRRVR